MHIPTHILSGWCIGNCFPLTARERLHCMIAASAADLDGLGILFGEATYQQYHHVVGHNLLIGIACSGLLAACARSITRSISLFALYLALFHLHLVMDYFGSGPNWPIYYLWPMGVRFKFVNPNAWPFFSWQNISAALAMIVWMLVTAYAKRRTPIELIAPRLDRKWTGSER